MGVKYHFEFKKYQGEGVFFIPQTPLTVHSQAIFQIKIMNVIAESLNFTYTISPPSDGALWGEEIEPGVFSGILGELQKDNADVIWATLYVTPDRFEYLDYTAPYATDNVCYMVACIKLVDHVIKC